jgi:hypothetical protein
MMVVLTIVFVFASQLLVMSAFFFQANINGAPKKVLRVLDVDNDGRPKVSDDLFTRYDAGQPVITDFVLSSSQQVREYIRAQVRSLKKTKDKSRMRKKRADQKKEREGKNAERVERLAAVVKKGAAGQKAAFDAADKVEAEAVVAAEAARDMRSQQIWAGQGGVGGAGGSGDSGGGGCGDAAGVEGGGGDMGGGDRGGNDEASEDPEGKVAASGPGDMSSEAMVLAVNDVLENAEFTKGKGAGAREGIAREGRGRGYTISRPGGRAPTKEEHRRALATSLVIKCHEEGVKWRDVYQTSSG